ncbi:MAG: LSM domain-containing protein, partial [Candidatus Freyarchaeota archaeon]
GFDVHMNLILGEAEEVLDKDSEPKQIGTVVVRGDNVIMLSPAVKSDTE